MDPNWFKTELPKDCYQCILCHAVIPVKNKKKDKFEKHLKSDHGIFYNRNLILVICFLGRIQFFKLIDSIKSEKHTRDAEVQTDKHLTSDTMMQTDDDPFESIEENKPDDEDDQVTTRTLMDQIDKLTSVLKLNGQQDAKTMMDELASRDHSTPSLETFEETYDDSASEISDVCDTSIASNDEEEAQTMDELVNRDKSDTLELTYDDSASEINDVCDASDARISEGQLEETVSLQEE